MSVGSAPLTGTVQRRFNSTETIKEEIGSIGASASEKITDVISNVPVDQIGYFQSVGIAQSWWWPPGFFQHVFEMTHVYTGLPWWATIGIVTVALRGAMFPFYMKASNATAKMQQVKPELNRLMREYNTSDDPLDAQKILMDRRNLMLKHDIKTRQLMYPILGVPFFIGIFSALNGMAKVPVHGLMDQGLFWFHNLAATDPYLGLQVLTASLYALTFKLGGETGSNTLSPAMQKVFTWLPFVAVPMTMGLPAASCYYFLLNGAISIGQTVAFKNAWFRRKTGMAPMLPPPVDPNETTGIMDSLRQTYEKTKARAEKAQREAAREALLKDEKKRNDARGYIQRDPNVKRKN